MTTKQIVTFIMGSGLIVLLQSFIPPDSVTQKKEPTKEQTLRSKQIQKVDKQNNPQKIFLNGKEVAADTLKKIDPKLIKTVSTRMKDNELRFFVETY